MPIPSPSPSPGCSLSAAVALLWPHGLGLYRLSARDALFVRGDVAQQIGLEGPKKPWAPADEFQHLGKKPWFLWVDVG